MAKRRLETLSLRLARDDGDELGLVACDCTARLLATNLQRHVAQRRTETQSQTSSMVEHRGGHIARIPNMVFFKLLVFGECFFGKMMCDPKIVSVEIHCHILSLTSLFWKFVGKSRRRALRTESCLPNRTLVLWEFVGNLGDEKRQCRTRFPWLGSSPLHLPSGGRSS